MADVLIVDDSEVDRRLVEGVLAKDKQLKVRSASNGVEALLAMNDRLPDVVLTDMQMPEMDGFELVAAIREKYPIVPVVLITSRGSEETAVKALQAGAASYVPKRVVADLLLRTVHRVLELLSEKRTLNRIGRQINRWSCSVKLDGQPAMFTSFADYLCTALEQLGIFSAADRLQLGMAIEQALEDTFFHCNLEIDPALRSSDPQAYIRLLDQRSGDPTYRDRRVEVEATLCRDRLQVIVRHGGRGEALADLVNAEVVKKMDCVTGRGINLITTFMDSIEYDDDLKQLTISKQIKC